MAKPKPHAGPKPKAAEHKQGFVDRLIHGDHGHASESEEAEVSEPTSEENAKDVAGVSPEPSIDPIEENQVSVEQGASSESKHHHKKFDKFKKGN